MIPSILQGAGPTAIHEPDSEMMIAIPLGILKWDISYNPLASFWEAQVFNFVVSLPGHLVRQGMINNLRDQLAA
jgi:hypothetical protein